MLLSASSSLARQEIASLIQEIGEACRRPLYTEINLFERKFQLQQQEDSSYDHDEVYEIKTVNTIDNAENQEQKDERSSNKSSVYESEKRNKTSYSTQQQQQQQQSQTKTSSNKSSQSTGAKNKAPQRLQGSKAASGGEKDVSETPLKQTWQELLFTASKYLPLMTDDEHGEVLRLASILFLGFLFPHSTGNDFYLLQNMETSLAAKDNKSRMTKNAKTGNHYSIDIHEYIINIPLEKRLEKCLTKAQRYSAGQCSEFHSLSNDATGYVDAAFDSFLQDGIQPLLKGRPAHTRQVDLLHLIAMAIQPQPVYEFPAPEGIPTDSSAWQKAKRLMDSLFASQFQINYSHRVQLIKLITSSLVLPSFDDSEDDFTNNSITEVGPLLYGSLQHCRASLRSFSLGAVSYQDAVLAQKAIAVISTQTQDFQLFLKTDWDYILHRMVDDTTEYHSDASDCNICPYTQSPPGKENDSFCPHVARGELLSEFFLMASPRLKSSNHSSNASKFLELSIVSLTEAIEWQTDSWTVSGDPGKKSTHSPCLLAAWLLAANSLFYFQKSAPIKAFGGEEDGSDEDDDPYNTLIHCSIQLLRHSHKSIVAKAADLLTHAFSKNYSNVKNYQKLMVQTLKVVLDKQSSNGLMLEKLVSVTSHRSSHFAVSIFDFLMNQIKSKDETDVYYRLIAAICLHCPDVVSDHEDRLIALLKSTKDEKNRAHLAACMLSNRMAYFFVQKENKFEGALSKFFQFDTKLSSRTDFWAKYQLGQHALITGNFAVADQLYSQILGQCNSLKEKYYLWISSLQNIASAEAGLDCKGAMGVPSASTKIHSAISYLQSLSSGCFDTANGPLGLQYTFQIQFLLLRLDFLDLLTILRQLTREMRLTAAGPAKNTRPHLHLTNVIRGFACLASKYRELLQRHGIFFQHRGSSIQSLRLLESLSTFLSVAAKAVFSDVLATGGNRSNTGAKAPIPIASFLDDHLRHPLAALMRRLFELVVEPMDGSLDPRIRAAAMLELLDGVLMAPFPFPRDFLHPRLTHRASIQILDDPDQSLDQQSSSESETTLFIEAYPSICFTFNAVGHIPAQLIAQCKEPISTLLLWYRILYCSPLSEDDGAAGGTRSEGGGGGDEGETSSNKGENNPIGVPKEVDLSSFSPVSCRLSRSGDFFLSVECPPLSAEGLYRLELRVGCRDATGNEWQIPVEGASTVSPTSVSLRVARSR